MRERESEGGRERAREPAHINLQVGVPVESNGEKIYIGIDTHYLFINAMSVTNNIPQF